MTTSLAPYWIVIAWVTMDGLEPTGRDVRFDRYNTRPEYRAAPLAKACTWIHGEEADTGQLAKAVDHAKEYGYTVFTYDEREQDPLGRARADALRKFHAGKLGLAK